jgi:selenocysteine lyase/cysteine desulfurase
MSTERIRAAYSRFLEPKRILLSGHSHQAWPDVARAAQLEVFDDAARYVDEKWEKVLFPLIDEVGREVLARMGFPSGDAIAFAESTHALVERLFSAFDLAQTRVITTTSEFHSLDRQLRRYAEAGLSVTWVAGQPRASLADRTIRAIEAEKERPLVVALSAVLFEDAWVQHEISEVIAAAERAEATVLVDAYHAFNAVPLDWGGARERAFVVAGGYKYAGFGNGLCWLRIPKDCELRPVNTGWFADFAALAEIRDSARPIGYGPAGARFAGATFEASAFYRARAVLGHWRELGLGVAELRAISLAQTRRVIDGLRDLRAIGSSLELVSSDDDARRGAFVSLRHARAGALCQALREHGVWLDSRGELLRVGPAPYLYDEEIDRALALIAWLSR